jgi:6,7-dimethyl-8-ribityllumazine synthase
MAKFDLQDGDYAANGARIALIASRFNQHIVSALLDGAYEALLANGVAETNITLIRVPGAFELPFAAQRAALTGTVDAVVCIGAVVRGGTPHFEFVAGECARGLMNVSINNDLPVIFGVITTDTEQQALDRCGGSEGNKGEEAALAALESLNAVQQLKRS